MYIDTMYIEDISKSIIYVDRIVKQEQHWWRSKFTNRHHFT